MAAHFAHYFEAKVERGYLLEYSIRLVHIPPPSAPRNLEYTQDRQSRRLLQVSGKTAASLNVYYEKSVVLVLILS